MTVPDYRDPRLTGQRNPRTERIDVASTLEIVDLLNAEDATVAGAVRAVRAELARAIDLVVDALGRGGRLIYVGAGTSGRLGVLDASECPPTFGTPPEMVVGVIAGGYPALVKSSEGAEDDVNAGMAAMDQARVTPAHFVLGITRRAPAGASRDVRRPGAPEGRAGSPDGVDPHEGGYRHEARPQHALHRRDDPARPRVWQPHGGPDGAVRQAAGPRGADRHGMLQRGPRGGARCDRSGRRECEAGDRDGASRGAEGGGGTAPGGCRRVRTPEGGGARPRPPP